MKHRTIGEQGACEHLACVMLIALAHASDSSQQVLDIPDRRLHAHLEQQILKTAGCTGQAEHPTTSSACGKSIRADGSVLLRGLSFDNRQPRGFQWIDR